MIEKIIIDIADYKNSDDAPDGNLQLLNGILKTRIPNQSRVRFEKIKVQRLYSQYNKKLPF